MIPGMAESIAAALAETQQCGASAEHAESAYKQRGDIAGFEAAGLSFAVCVCLDGACRCRGGLCRSSRLCRCSGGLRSSCGCTGRNDGLFCKAHRAGLQAQLYNCFGAVSLAPSPFTTEFARSWSHLFYAIFSCFYAQTMLY